MRICLAVWQVSVLNTLIVCLSAVVHMLSWLCTCVNAHVLQSQPHLLVTGLSQSWGSMSVAVSHDERGEHSSMLSNNQ